jgi:transposase-like protein
VRCYFRFKLSYRDLVEMMAERGLSMAHTTIMRWVHYLCSGVRAALESVCAAGRGVMAGRESIQSRGVLVSRRRASVMLCER